MKTELANKSIELLKQLIATPSLSKEEDKTAAILFSFLKNEGVEAQRYLNNVWAVNKYFDPNKETLMLNSHHDTVKPNNGYTNPPFEPIIKDDKLFGLGSNDAGGPLVSLIAAFLHFYKKLNLAYNIVLACTAEEEISGKNGIVELMKVIPTPSVAIIGEPTLMTMAIAEKGLMVLECTAHGKAGHAARNEGENAIYKALKDIEWIQSYEFPVQSKMLGPVKMTTTVINAGSQHNVIPDRCYFTVDVRTTDVYSNDQTLEIIQQHIKSNINPKSLRLNPSSIKMEHPLIQSGISLGMHTYGSPTLSDQSLISIPSLKLGPGDSARSHTPDEFIFLAEIEEGIEKYVKLLEKFLNYKPKNK
ncbi:Acetylornithine deacetylase [hydrothermal vent metagenome]|uniref:Acetylornithine deacetylase n=1 Tax=hydrothermal vent metagenome TaxID=652676 RepID=A0A3B0UDK1_9ZZZZ